MCKFQAAALLTNSARHRSAPGTAAARHVGRNTVCTTYAATCSRANSRRTCTRSSTNFPYLRALRRSSGMRSKYDGWMVTKPACAPNALGPRSRNTDTVRPASDCAALLPLVRCEGGAECSNQEIDQYANERNHDKGDNQKRIHASRPWKFIFYRTEKQQLTGSRLISPTSQPPFPWSRSIHCPVLNLGQLEYAFQILTPEGLLSSLCKGRPLVSILRASLARNVSDWAPGGHPFLPILTVSRRGSAACKPTADRLLASLPRQAHSRPNKDAAVPMAPETR